LGESLKLHPEGYTVVLPRLRKTDYGEKILLLDGSRKIAEKIRKDIRPDRTARSPLKEML
jgi:hypothetical protein